MSTVLFRCPQGTRRAGFSAIKRWRRNNRRRFNRLLARLLGRTPPCRRPLAPGTRRILVVRLNRRLGNILFLTPMLRTLAASLPAASIDVIIQDPAQKPLLESLPGVGRVWIQRKSLLALLGLYRDIRARHYDLAIDPVGNSASNRLAIALSGARQRMGFVATDQWLPLTHAAVHPTSRHLAIQGVELLEATIADLDLVTFDTLAVFPDSRAVDAATSVWRGVLERRDPHAPVIGFFTAATGRKRLSADWWRSWVAAVHRRCPEAALIEIRPPGDVPPLADDLPSVSLEALDVLAALMARLSVFVAADSGPMHLAAAAGVPVIGLFRATQPAAYAPLGLRCISLTGDALDPDHVAEKIAQRLAEEMESRLVRPAFGG